ncbi:hypothetical protein SLEP1_g3269 [Rubroshorea leprosula]|uniref:Uncharacterized protein n=1 Tax=Rubroshorea leprosula TaxID=152421 RepID=A0AAV5HV97_9ROSI|nr:hypothetical protein SLEP1_g3269 [Rubroshorea leprosula]
MMSNGRVWLELEKNAAVIEKKHHLELDALSEQMRMKEEKQEYEEKASQGAQNKNKFSSDVSQESNLEGRCKSVEVDDVDKLVSTNQSSSKMNKPTWRMDLQALEVSYKIKRAKQQLLLLQWLMGMQESGEDIEAAVVIE